MYLLASAVALHRLPQRCTTHSCRGIRTHGRAQSLQACARGEPSQQQVLQLQVSSPALLLNHMAERYASTSRILMEFVDNSLDDAEAMYDHNAGAYRRDVLVDVYVSRAERSLRILDNCRGMEPETLSRVVMRVGESRKRGASFVNGQFGFGASTVKAAVSVHALNPAQP